MAGHSTRRMIREQCDKAVVHLDHVMERLQRIDELSENRNSSVVVALPPLVAACEIMQNTIRKLRVRC